MSLKLLFKVNMYMLQSSAFMVLRTDSNDSNIRSDCYGKNLLFNPRSIWFLVWVKQVTRGPCSLLIQ